MLIKLVAAYLLLISISGRVEGLATCKTVVSRYTKVFMKTMNACSMAEKGKGKSSSFGCVARCVMMKQELLDENGQISMEVFNNFLTAKFPSHLINYFNGTFFPCTMTERPIPVKEDEDCVTVEPFFKCFIEVSKQLCDNSED